MRKILISICTLSTSILFAQEVITNSETLITTEPSVSYQAVLEAPLGSTVTATPNSFVAGQSYSHTFSGQKNVRLQSVTINQRKYLFGNILPNVTIRRNNTSGVTPTSTAQAIPWNNRQILYAEGSVNSTDKTINAVAGFPGTPGGTASNILDIMRNGYINLGIDNLFNNIEGSTTGGDTNANNIERIDFVYPIVTKVTKSNLNTGGILISNRGSNDDPLVFAAIKNLTAGTNIGGGTNYQYANIIRLNATWTNKTVGTTTTSISSSQRITSYGPMNFLTYRRRDTDGTLHDNDSASTNNPALTNTGTNQNIQSLFFTFMDLGLQPGDEFNGLSVAGNDFPATAGSNELNSFSNTSFFPTNTSVTNGGVDFVLNGLFNFLSINGKVWNDRNANGIVDTGELPTNAGGLNAVLVNSSNVVLDVNAVTATGEYVLNGLLPNTNGYKIILTTNNPAIGSTYTAGPSLPVNWANTRDVADPSNTASQGTELGVIELNTKQDQIENQNFGIKGLCYRPAVTAGTALPTRYGITSLGKAGANNGNWPMVRTGGWATLEAKTKGFVINRLTTSQKNALVPVEGMMVYDTDLDCLNIYDGASWKCYSIQTCTDNP